MCPDVCVWLQIWQDAFGALFPKAAFKNLPEDHCSILDLHGSIAARTCYSGFTQRSMVRPWAWYGWKVGWKVGWTADWTAELLWCEVIATHPLFGHLQGNEELRHLAGFVAGFDLFQAMIPCWYHFRLFMAPQAFLKWFFQLTLTQLTTNQSLDKSRWDQLRPSRIRPSMAFAI